MKDKKPNLMKKGKAHPMAHHVEKMEQALAGMKQQMTDEGGGEEKLPPASGVSPLGGMAK